MRVPLLLLPLALLAGCFHADPPPQREEPIAVFTLVDLEGAEERAFEVPPGVAYWRTDLRARMQQAVTYEARAPSGTTHESDVDPAAGQYWHAIRVDGPEPGIWNITIEATKIVDGELRILVPVG